MPGIAFVPNLTAFPGGLPIMTADKVQIGAIGVSGATGDQDESCAQAPPRMTSNRQGAV